MEQTIRETEQFLQLVEGQNPENASALLHHQPNQSSQQLPATRDEYNCLTDIVKGLDTRLTAQLTIVNESGERLRTEVNAINAQLTIVNGSVESLRNEVNASNAKVNEMDTRLTTQLTIANETLQQIMNKLNGFQSCQCGVSERK